MKARFPLFVGLRFFRAGSRTGLASFISVLAISGLVLGIAMLIIVLSVMNGFDREMRSRILGVIPHIQLLKQEAEHSGAVSGGFDDWRQLARQIVQHPSVTAVIPFTQVDGLLNVRGHTEAVQLQGLSRNHPATRETPLLAQLPDFTHLQDNEIILSRFLINKLGLSIGQKLTFISASGGEGKGRALALPKIRVFTLAGELQTHTALDAHLGLVGLAVASELAGYPAWQAGERDSYAQGLKITVEDVFAARSVAYELLDQLPPGHSFIDWYHTHGNLYMAIQMSRKLVSLLVFLIIAIAAFNVIAMLIMSVINKRGDIAILKSQGASNREILAIFLVQGSTIGLFGALLGALLGCIGAWYVSDLLTWVQKVMEVQFLDVSVYPIDYLPSDLRAADVALVVGIALALNLLATLYPAWRAARVHPAVELRYE
ncbi:MAG TPA: hypothetical protein DCF62_04865 [Porticoccaceae bacterium]|nr:hypothetical protein [Porticoccaceae bacterium]HCO61881.1 hypothetical protein [Porticoccaceae bacterium]